MQRVDTGLSKYPAHVLVCPNGQNRSIGCPMITGIKTISRGKGNFGTSKTCRDVSTCVPRPFNISDREFNLGGPRCPTLAPVTVDSHSKPGSVQGTIFNKRNQTTAKLCAFFCKRQRESILGKIRIKSTDHRVVFEHQVVRDSDIRVGDITDASQAQFPRMRICTVGDQLVNIYIVTTDISC